MRRFTVLPNDEEMLLINLSSKVWEKNLGQKNNFPKFVFWIVKIGLVQKSYQYSYSNSPLFGPIVKNPFSKFFTIAALASYKSVFFFQFGTPK